MDDEIEDYLDFLKEDYLNQRGFAFTFCKELMIAVLDSRRDKLSGLIDVDAII